MKVLDARVLSDWWFFSDIVFYVIEFLCFLIYGKDILIKILVIEFLGIRIDFH